MRFVIGILILCGMALAQTAQPYPIVGQPWESTVFTGILGAEDLSVSVTPPVGAPINPASAVSVTCGVPETLLSHPVTIEVPNGATITFTV